MRGDVTYWLLTHGEEKRYAKHYSILTIDPGDDILETLQITKEHVKKLYLFETKVDAEKVDLKSVQTIWFDYIFRIGPKKANKDD